MLNPSSSYTLKLFPYLVSSISLLKPFLFFTYSALSTVLPLVQFCTPHFPVPHHVCLLNPSSCHTLKLSPSFRFTFSWNHILSLCSLLHRFTSPHIFYLSTLISMISGLPLCNSSCSCVFSDVQVITYQSSFLNITPFVSSLTQDLSLLHLTVNACYFPDVYTANVWITFQMCC